MNILFVTTHLNTGGISTYILNLASALKKRGNNIIIASSGGELVNEITRRSIQHIKINIKTKSELSPKVFFAISSLVKIIKENKIDIIHAHTRVTQVASFFASKITKKPYVATGHGFYNKRLGRILLKCLGDRTVAISDSVRKDLLTVFRLSPEKVKTIYSGIDIDRFSKSLTKDEIEGIRGTFNIKGSPVIGIISRLSEEKGHIFLIRAFESILKEGFPEANLVIVGEGRLEGELKREIVQRKISEKVYFLGKVSDTSEMLPIFDVFVLPSIKEGLGLSAIEAMAAGIPCVVTNTGGFRDFIVNNENGVLVEPGNEDSLKDAVIRILKDKGMASKFSENGKKFARNFFSIDTMAKNIEELYKEIKPGNET